MRIARTGILAFILAACASCASGGQVDLSRVLAVAGKIVLAGTRCAEAVATQFPDAGLPTPPTSSGGETVVDAGAP